MEEETIGLTKELIRIPSENPTGTEAAVAERVEAYLRGLGIEVERDPVVDGRENLIAEVGGPANGPALVFLNHMDTVPVGEGWTRDPFDACEEDGRIWGRGSCDMKGGLAAGLTALKSLKARLDRGARAARTVRCCLVVDEEGPWMRGASPPVYSNFPISWKSGRSSLRATTRVQRSGLTSVRPQDFGSWRSICACRAWCRTPRWLKERPRITTESWTELLSLSTNFSSFTC